MAKITEAEMMSQAKKAVGRTVKVSFRPFRMVSRRDETGERIRDSRGRVMLFKGNANSAPYEIIDRTGFGVQAKTWKACLKMATEHLGPKNDKSNKALAF